MRTKTSLFAIATAATAAIVAACSSADEPLAGAPPAAAIREAPGASGSDGGESAAADAASEGGPVASGPCDDVASTPRFTCSKDGTRRGRCVGGKAEWETCARGCLRNKAPAEDACMLAADAWTCTGVQGTSKALDGSYYMTYFGCWVDAAGVHHADPNDNCLPGCFSQAQAAGLCKSNETGKQCEEKTVWFTANNGRFGCLSRLRIENPKNGKAVVAVVLDGGPACSAEQKIKKAMLDTSAPVFNHLFDDGKTWTTTSYVHVVEVDGSTPLGVVR